MFIWEKTSQGCGVFFFDSDYSDDSGYSSNSYYRGQIMHELCTNYARIYEWVNNFCGRLLQEETNVYECS